MAIGGESKIQHFGGGFRGLPLQQLGTPLVCFGKGDGAITIQVFPQILLQGAEADVFDAVARVVVAVVDGADSSGGG